MCLDAQELHDLAVSIHAHPSDMKLKVLLRSGMCTHTLPGRQTATHHAGACEVVSTLMAVMP
jgi:hypothetical protein